ncbi:MAG: YceI family protein [Vulcanimicrobiaceae bacterium]
MRSRRLFAALFCLAVVAPARAGERAIDPRASKATFSVTHIFVARVDGTVPLSGGTVTLAAGSAIPLSATAVLDPGNVNTGDADQSACIRSPDYFDVAKFPEMTFRSTKIESDGPASFGMDGLMTIHGVSRPEHLEVTVAGDPLHPTYHAVGRIDRHAFGMRGARLDPTIGGIVDVTLDIVVQ